MPQAPNVMAIHREQLPKGELADFRSKIIQREKYQVAARLWASGMDWPTAFKMTKEVFAEAASQ